MTTRVMRFKGDDLPGSLGYDSTDGRYFPSYVVGSDTIEEEFVAEGDLFGNLFGNNVGLTRAAGTNILASKYVGVLFNRDAVTSGEDIVITLDAALATDERPIGFRIWGTALSGAGDLETFHFVGAVDDTGVGVFIQTDKTTGIDTPTLSAPDATSVAVTIPTLDGLTNLIFYVEILGKAVTAGQITYAIVP